MPDRSGRRTRDPAAAARRAGVFFLFAALLAGVVKPLRAEEAPQGPVERVTVNGQGETAAPLDPTAFATVIHAEDFADRLTSVEELMRGAAGFSGTYGRSEISIGVDSFSTRGDFPYLSDNGTGSESRDDFVTSRRNNDVRRDHLTGRTTLRLGERIHLSFNTDLLKSDEGVAGVGSTLSSKSRYSTRRYLLRSELDAPGFWGGRLLFKGAADYGDYAETFDNLDGSIGLGLGTHNQIITLGQELGLVVVADAHQALSVLTSHRSETADP